MSSEKFCSILLWARKVKFTLLEALIVYTYIYINKLERCSPCAAGDQPVHREALGQPDHRATPHQADLAHHHRQNTRVYTQAWPWVVAMEISFFFDWRPQVYIYMFIQSGRQLAIAKIILQARCTTCCFSLNWWKIVKMTDFCKIIKFKKYLNSCPHVISQRMLWSTLISP